MTINNPILYNAALIGAYAAAGSEAVPAVNAPALAQAVVIAAAVDAGIPADATITSAGATLPPTTAAITNAELSKTALLRSIVFATFLGQASPPSGTALAALVTAIVAKYTAGIAGLSIV